MEYCSKCQMWVCYEHGTSCPKCKVTFRTSIAVIEVEGTKPTDIELITSSLLKQIKSTESDKCQPTSGDFGDITENVKIVAFQQQIVDFLITLPSIQDSHSQQAFLNSVGLDEKLQNQLNVNQPPLQFINLLVSICAKYGTLQDGRDALIAVLESAKTYVGQDKKKYCSKLIEELQNCNNSATLHRSSNP